MPNETNEPEMILRLLEGLKQASSSAHQLAHARQSPPFLYLRDAIEGLTDMMGMLVAAKSLPRAQVLKMMDVRQSAIGPMN